MKLAGTISFVLLFAITLTVSGQKGGKQTVVLNDGTRITGTIVADSSEYIKLRVLRPMVITLSKHAVYSYDPENTLHRQTNDKQGYYISLSSSLLAGGNEYGNTGSVSLHLSNGFRFRNGLSAGFGSGVEKLDVTVIPVYADFRFHPMNTRVSPFVYLKSGYGIPLNNDEALSYTYYYHNPEEKGGFMFNAGTGVAIYSWRGNAVNIGLGYRYQQLIFRQIGGIGPQMTTNEVVTRFNRIEVQFGFIFR